MSYNTELQQNNTELEDILAMVNALPNAGSGNTGGSIETCTFNQVFFSEMSSTMVSLKSEYLEHVIPDITRTVYVLIHEGQLQTILKPSNGYTGQVILNTNSYIPINTATNDNGETILRFSGSSVQLDNLRGLNMSYLLEIT